MENGELCGAESGAQPIRAAPRNEVREIGLEVKS